MSSGNGVTYFNRVGYVRMAGPDGQMYQYGWTSANGSSDNTLDFKFSIKVPVGAVHTQAQIGILGLNRETIEWLTYFGMRSQERAQKRKIEVYGGYADTGPGLLFSGYIFTAIPSMPPDRWLNITADNYSCADGGVLSNSFEDATVRSIVEYCCKKLGYELNWDSSIKTKKVPKCKICGTFDNAIKTIEQLDSDIFMFVDKSTVYVQNRNTTNGMDRGKVISTENGMLNIDHVGIDGIKVRTRLTSDYKRGSVITVKSEMIPAANGDYLVYEVAHNGQFRGDKWETTVSAYMTGAMLEKVMKSANQ